jgi:acyl-coenzyme A thioesterase PaaI-like protein
VVADEVELPWPDVDVPADPDWDKAPVAPRGGAEFAALHAAQRLLQDRLSGAAVPQQLAAELTAQLLDVCERLAPHQMPEPDRIDGWRPDLPGRGHPLLPPYFIDDETDTLITGHVTFTRFYLGGNGAAHGGAHPLLFDDVFGRVMNHQQPGVARTAYLKVNYRRITPLDVQLRFDASCDRVEGRKRWGTARLYDPDGTVVSDAEALFLELLPGQP